MIAPVSRRVARAYVLCAAVLGLTGTFQMPIASRYRIAALPGLGWLANFWLTHRLHYAAACGLLLIASYVATRWLLEWRRERALTALGWLWAASLSGLVLTGAMRVLKNLPDVSFSPVPTMLGDWLHLGLAALLGLLALAHRLGPRYTKPAAQRAKAPAATPLLDD